MPVAHVHLTEVGPRDGLQAEETLVSTKQKIQLVELLESSGLRELEVASFVRPDLIPQMADAGEVVRGLPRVPSGVVRTCLVPNLKGYEMAVAAGMRKVAVFTAATDAFNRANISTDIEGSLKRFQPVVERAAKDGVTVRAYISAAFICPIDGKVAPEATLDVTRRLQEMGIAEIVLGDTTGSATPGEVMPILDVIQPLVSPKHLGLHFHDTMGSGLVNVYAALQRGILRYDTSVGGLGGCPNAPGAAGNVATEDVIWLLNGLGFQHGIELEGVLKAAQFIQSAVGHPLTGRVLRSRSNPSSGSD